MTYAWKLDDRTTIDLATQDDVFFPTATSLALIEALRAQKPAPGKLLDLGCGCGVVGIAAQKLGLVKGSLYASDLSEAAAACTRVNCERHGVAVDARAGSLFEPWGNERFDYILDDVSGVAEEVAAVSTWFKNVPCAAGIDGTDLVVKVIESAPAHLNKGGLLFFPVISLSNTKKIVETAVRVFGQAEKVSRQEWPLPPDMRSATELLMRLQKEGHVTVEKKFGMVVLYTDIYVARN